MLGDQAIKKILLEENERASAEYRQGAPAFRGKHGTFDWECVAIYAAMRRAFQLGEES